MVRQVPDPSIFKANTAQGNRKPLFSVGNGTGEKNKSSNSNVQFNRSDFGSIHKTFIRHRRSNTSRRTMGSSSIVLALLVSMAKGVPHYYLEGYGCTLTAAASEWSHQMHITQPALHGYLWASNNSITFMCPPEYGIIAQINVSAASSSGWNSHPKCQGTFYRSPYSSKELEIDQAPAYIEYMCAKHYTNVWYAGSFTIDRANRISEQIPPSQSMFATAYTSSNYYRSMQYSAAALILAGLLVIGANMLESVSLYHKGLLILTTLLTLVAFFSLVISVIEISKASPRPYSGRKAHQVLGLITLVAIPFSLILGAIAFWNNAFMALFDTVATIMLLLVLATSSVALIGFYDYNTAVIVSISVSLGIVFLNSYVIRRKKQSPKYVAKTVVEEEQVLLVKKNGVVNSRSTRNRKTYF